MQKEPEQPESAHDADTTELTNPQTSGALVQAQPVPAAVPAPAGAPAGGPIPDPDPGTGSDENGSLAAFWETVKRLPKYLRLVNALARDPRIPRRSKGALVVGGAYAVSPIDLVPGVIPVAGQVDDLYVLLTALQQAIRMSPKDVVNEHLAATQVSRDEIEADLANVRSLVRQGVVWSVRNGGRAVASMGRNLGAFVTRQRRKGG